LITERGLATQIRTCFGSQIPVCLQTWKTVQLIKDAMVKAAGEKTVSWREAPVSASSTQRKSLLNPAFFKESMAD
jgi:hypothetical protein